MVLNGGHGVLRWIGRGRRARRGCGGRSRPSIAGCRAPSADDSPCSSCQVAGRTSADASSRWRSSSRSSRPGGTARWPRAAVGHGRPGAPSGRRGTVEVAASVAEAVRVEGFDAGLGGHVERGGRHLSRHERPDGPEHQRTDHDGRGHRGQPGDASSRAAARSPRPTPPPTAAASTDAAMRRFTLELPMRRPAHGCSPQPPARRWPAGGGRPRRRRAR